MDISRGVTEFRRRHRWLAAVLLGVVGFALNLEPVPLSPGTDLVFGGVAYLLAAVALGPVAGVVAAGIASSRTLWVGSHPYAWVIFALEALVVGWLVRRWGRRPLVADLFYWAFCGVPLLFVTYYLVLGVSGSTAAVLFLKQPFNGLVNAMAAELLLLVPPVRRMLGVRGAPALRSALAVVVAIAATVPTLMFGLWSGRREWDRNLERTRERVQLFAQSHSGRVEEYVRLHERAVRLAAQTAARGGTGRAELQRLVELEHQEFPSFVGVYAADAGGRVLAFHPAARPEGERLLGTELADAAYVRRLFATGKTVVSQVFSGRGAAQGPLVAIAHPILRGDTLAGFVAGALDLEAIPPPRPLPGPGERLLVTDSAGAVVFDSRRPYRRGDRPRSLADSASFTAVTGVGAAGTTTYAAPGAPAAASATSGRMLAGVAHIPSLGWWVWIEQPYAGIQAFVAESYVRLLALLIAATLLALVASNLLSAYLARPLLRMREAAAGLGAGRLEARVGRLPAAVPAELAELGRDFDEMAGALAGRTEELEELGEIARSLASTLDAGEVLRRVTDAAVRLVEPDGCGIALLLPGGRALRTADYSLGLLRASAGRELPAEGSLAGWVAREGEPALILDAAADPRVGSEYLDPQRAGSVICAPLAGRSGPLGTLTAVRARGHPQPFTEGDLRLLDRLARHAAIAVENAHLVELERRRARESEAIRKVARTVTAAQGLQDTLALVVREAARIVGAEACRVKLLRDDGQLEVVAVSGPADMPVGTILPVRGPLLEGPVLRGDTVVASDGDNAASAPLRVGMETLGVLTAHHRATPFAPEDAALLGAFADHAAIALRNARLLEAAQAASRAKSDFIATMSHELRTPLNAVLGHLQLLEMEIHGKLTPRQREALGRIEAASRHLRGLIEEVLSFARLEAGRTTTRIEEVDLCSLAAEVAAVIEPLAAEKQVGFTSDGCDPQRALVPTDPDKVRQILINLAGNAVKFTEAGEVRIRVEDRGAEVALAVADTGPGIAPEDRDRLFQPFEQLESGFSRPHGGTGLGLYLSGEYARLVGGRIEVESEVGRGSTFTLVLPRELSEEVAEHAENVDTAGSAAPAAGGDDREQASHAA